MIVEGRCHCGNLSYTLHTQRDDLAPRACGCGFCRMHDAKSVSDPHGEVAFAVRDHSLVSFYRFGLRTADFLICRACGIYVGAVIESGGQQRAIVNPRASDSYDLPAAAVSYDAENEAERIARRLTRWTPVRGRVAEQH